METKTWPRLLSCKQSSVELKQWKVFDWQMTRDQNTPQVYSYHPRCQQESLPCRRLLCPRRPYLKLKAGKHVPRFTLYEAELKNSQVNMQKVTNPHMTYLSFLLTKPCNWTRGCHLPCLITQHSSRGTRWSGRKAVVRLARGLMTVIEIWRMAAADAPALVPIVVGFDFSPCKSASIKSRGWSIRLSGDEWWNLNK